MSQIVTVSVCITTFQHVDYIEECVLSVLRQSADVKLEVLVGDDGSTDGARDVIARLALTDPRVRVFEHPNRLGPCANLQHLVAAASGDYIAHLDGDDSWETNKLARQLHCFDDPRVVAVYSNATVVTAQGAILGRFNDRPSGSLDLRELLRRGNFLNHSSLVYRADVRGMVLGLLGPFIDYRLHIRLATQGSLAYLDEALVRYRWRSTTSMVRTMPSAVISGHADALAEALAAGAPAKLVRSAASRFWGKAVVLSVLNWEPVVVQAAVEPLLRLRHAGITRSWLIWHAVLAPLRALKSLGSRKRGVYFP